MITLSLRDLPATVLELEGLLGAPLADVLGATATGDGRLLLIDGAEAALEGRERLLTATATAALRAGLGVAAVTRADGARVVSQALADAAGAAGLADPVGEHVVGRLTAAEIAQIAAAFPVACASCWRAAGGLAARPPWSCRPAPACRGGRMTCLRGRCARPTCSPRSGTG